MGFLYNASEYALGFDERQLQNTIKARDDQQYELLHSLLEREVSRTKPDLRQDIKTVLRTQLGTGSLSLSRAAAAFDLGERSFARRVERAGLSFSRLLDEVKYEAACTLLRTDLKLTEIAAVLFYSELGAFTRAFKRWSGETPKSWRQKHAFPKERALR
jgi:AraC-like DNA-binding protein